MEKLQGQLEELISKLDNAEELRNRLSELISVYPFNENEYIIPTLIGLGELTLERYYEIRDEYIARNLFLYIFEISAHAVLGSYGRKGILKNWYQS